MAFYGLIWFSIIHKTLIFIHITFYSYKNGKIQNPVPSGVRVRFPPGNPVPSGVRVRFPPGVLAW